MLKLAIPLLHVAASAAAEAFYRDRLGFRREFAHRADDAKPAPCYLGMRCDGVLLHLSSLSGDGGPGGVVNLVVEGIDALHAESVAKGVPVDAAPVTQTWGSREMYVRDPDGNCLRFVQP